MPDGERNSLATIEMDAPLFIRARRWLAMRFIWPPRTGSILSRQSLDPLTVLPIQHEEPDARGFFFKNAITVANKYLKSTATRRKCSRWGRHRRQLLRRRANALSSMLADMRSRRYAYAACEATLPGSFSAPINPAGPRTWMELLFLSVAVLSSVGLSDILPVTGMRARS